MDRAISYHQVITSGSGFTPGISHNIVEISWRSTWASNVGIWINGRETNAPTSQLITIASLALISRQGKPSGLPGPECSGYQNSYLHR